MSHVKGLGGKPLRGALVGTGGISLYHMRAWSAIPGVEIVAMANRTRSRAEALGRQFGVDDAHIYADYRDLMDREQVDFVDIATTPNVHREQVLAAAQHGLHVFCQKPFAPSLAEAEEMVAACGRAGVRCVVHENWRWRGYLQELKRMLGQGSIGATRYLRVHERRSSALPPPEGGLPPLLTERLDMAEMPRLIIYEWGLHLVDVIRFLMGDIQSVYARTSHLSPWVKGEDMAVVTFGLRSGATALMDISWGSLVEAGKGLVRGNMDPLIVEGDAGVIELDPYRDDSFIITTASGTECRPSRPGLSPADVYQNSYDRCLSRFVDCLRSGEPAENEGRDNVKVLAVVFAAYESAALNQVITLP
jgi:predicted dehydrogenase